MFQNESLQAHLDTSSTISHRSMVVAEWNMNILSNIDIIGNYRFRPNDPDSNYSNINNSYDPQDNGLFYTDATDADVKIDGGYQDDGTPTVYLSKKQKENILFSLEDCFGKFRPRSGINKARFFRNSSLHYPNSDMAQRPRYYMADKDDKFKYWCSYRTEEGIERGISNQTVNGINFIDDASPFVVYKNPVPANRIVVKMQTHVGSTDLGPFSDVGGNYDDPFYGDENSKTPVRWKIQYLQNNVWLDAMSFNELSARQDGSPVIGSDGYVELAYGLQVPEAYADTFNFVQELRNETLLPYQNIVGNAYLIRNTDTDVGTFYVWSGSAYSSFKASYGWTLVDGYEKVNSNLATELVSGPSFISPFSGAQEYREFKFVSGIRVVAETMNVVDATLDLIEMSPRLAVDLTEKTTSFKLTKSASDLGVSGMPVGQLLASVGSIELFDHDQAFNPNNPDSVIASYLTKNIQIKFYDVVANLDGYDYFIPIKTMYSEGFPDLKATDRTTSLTLRDMFFYLESITAPQTLLTNVSISSAISMLLDSIGFSNYVFKRADADMDEEIPYFFVAPDKTIIEVLQDIAISTQTAMFFDEYNNFVVMSKNYMMPSLSDRDTDIYLRGSEENGIANIVDVSSQNNNVYNSGVVSFTSRYIQRSYGSIRQASMVDQEKTWIYKPVLLWEVTGDLNSKSINNVVGNQSAYVLSAVPLNSDLSETIPTVSNHTLINNVIDFGEAVYWISRYNGYFYSSGEIVRYDAVQYSVPGQTGDSNVWITSVQEYQNYFSKIPFNGKMYPTGLVRIYSEPFYEEVGGITRLKNGAVRKHGRGQFGTEVVKHSAGIDPYWSNNDNVRGCSMDSEFLFNLTDSAKTRRDALSLTLGPAGVSNTKAKSATRNGIIKNFLSSQFKNESIVNQIQAVSPGTIQSSALVVNGPSFATSENPLDFISYVTKPLNNKFKHFGTRMRIVGKIENSDTRLQTPIGTTSYYNALSSSPDQSISIAGGSGGLAVMMNPENNNGYYFEIVALTEGNLETYTSKVPIYNILFYKIMQGPDQSAIPVQLWGGLGKITVDDGKFTGQYRMVGEENPTVYDLSVEYEDIGNTRKFYLYINNKLIGSAVDEDPMPVYNNMGLFVRGSSRCMFENIFAITNNYSQNTVYALNTPVNSAFQDDEINVNEAFRKYALSGIVQSSYLSGVSPSEPPKYNMYYDEFGSIMREAAYFNIRYDKAYPALYSKLSPTFNKIKGYTSSGYIAGSYGAEFMVFNSTDTVLNLDETSGNYLRIQGITFTQASEETVSVDDYFKKRSDFSNPTYVSDNVVVSPNKTESDYLDIKASRATHGINEFSLSSPYIQSKDAANGLMGWMISKIMKPRKSVGLKVFGVQNIQLGDIVQIDYKDSLGNDVISSADSRFVVYSIEYDRSSNGPEMTVFVSEVI